MTAPYIPPVQLIDARGNSPTFALSAAGSYMFPVSPTIYPVLLDTYDGTTIDTTYRWLPPVIAGAGAIAQGGGMISITLGTVAGAGAAMQSIESFTPSVANITAGGVLRQELAPSINTNRCWGFYTRPVGGAWTAATPVTDGYVLELDIAGTWGASIYNAGVRIWRQILPPPGPFFPATVNFQGLFASFNVMDLLTPAASIAVLEPSIITLPFGYHAINHTAGPAAAPTWASDGMSVIDTAGIYKTLFNGQTLQRIRAAGKFVALNNVSVAAEATIWTPAAGRKFRLMGYCLTAGGAAGNVVLKDNTAGAALPIVLPFGAIGANLTVVPPAMANGILSATAGNVLTATGAASQTLSGYLIGTEE
jgi:hypothetical protein